MVCEICGVDNVRVRFGHQSLCMYCYNALMASELGVDLPELPKVFVAEDTNGVRHIFDVERRIMVTGVILSALEQKELGYEFAVDGELDVDQHELLSRLMQKTRSGLLETCLETGEFPSGQPYTSVRESLLKGVITYDATNSEAPLLIIDGKPFRWEEVGRLLQAFEGFQVKIEMKDLTDEL